MIKMTIHHGEEVQQRNLPCDFLSLRMSLYQMNMMLAPSEVSVRDVQAEFTSTDPIGQKLISLIRPGDLLFFPAGEAGAHKLTNPSETEALVYLDFDIVHDLDVTVYPDSGKLGIWGKDTNKLYRIGDDVDYYEGE